MRKKTTGTTNRPVTLVDVAKKCGVSQGAVSQALRGGNGEVSEETRKRILATALEMGYDPSRNQSARRMVLQKHGTLPKNQTVCLIFPPDFYLSTYYTSILQGVLDVMTQHSYALQLVSTNIASGDIPAPLSRGEIDGLLALLDVSWRPEWVDSLRAEPLFGDRPIVGIVEPIKGCSSIRADDFQAGYQAAAHLLDLGHRYIAHDFQPGFYGTAIISDNSTSLRLEGILAAYRDRSLDPDQFLRTVDFPRREYQLEERAERLVRTLKEHPEITALCAPNDFTAVQTWGVLVSAGYRIPQDLSLVSFDDVHAIFTDRGKNILTSVRMPLREIGQEGAQTILKAISGESTGVEKLVLPTSLMVRKSTAPPAR